MSAEPATSSGLLTATTQIATRSCILYGFQINVAAADGTIVLYNSPVSTSDATKVVDKHLLKANNSGDNQWFGENGIYCDKGLYITLSGSGAEMVVYYNLV